VAACDGKERRAIPIELRSEVKGSDPEQFEKRGFVTGHDFSRADQVAKKIGL
jgi:hypothetical protein